jgi:serine/threonine-protein kinase
MNGTDRGGAIGPAAPLTDRVDLACDRFEAAWLAGSRPRIDDYLPAADGPERASYLRELLILELAYRRRDGEEPSFGEYAARFPEHRSTISALFGVPSGAEEASKPAEHGTTARCAGQSTAVPTARLTLEVVAGAHKGRLYSFQEHDSFIVGRSAQAHFQLPKGDCHFSRIHFLIEFNPPHCRLMDLQSTNGTLVNGKRVAKADLKDGDLIQGGTTSMRVTISPVCGKKSGFPKTVSYRGARTAAGEAVPVAPARDDETAEARTARPIGEAATLAPPVSQPVAERPSRLCRACGATISSHGDGSRADDHTLCPACSGAIASQPQPIAGYQIIRQLGRGAMGVVQLARRTSDGALVALKTIIPDAASTPEDIAKFLREARILSELRHPHIVRCVEVGDSAGYVYFAMEHVPGCDADRLVRKLGGPLPVARAVRLTCQLLDGLAYAHSRRFVHRDIKPSNLLVTVRDGEEVWKLADFGLARVYQSSRLSGLTITGDFGGTLAFMPPEQITRYRDVLPTSDIYSAGATLYYLLTRRYVHDFPKRTELRILKILEEEPVPIRSRREDLPRALADIIDRCLEREPEDRYLGAQSLREALLPFLQSGG